MAKQDDYVRYTIRVPKELYGLVEKAAAEANRSVNAEVVENLTFAQLDDLGDRVELLMKMRELERAHKEKETRSMEREVYWYNIALAVNRSLRVNLTQFRATLNHILIYKDDLPAELLKFTKEMLTLYEEQSAQFQSTDAAMKFFEGEAERASELVYAAPEGTDDPDFTIKPPMTEKRPG